MLAWGAFEQTTRRKKPWKFQWITLCYECVFARNLAKDLAKDLVKTDTSNSQLAWMWPMADDRPAIPRGTMDTSEKGLESLIVRAMTGRTRLW